MDQRKRRAGLALHLSYNMILMCAFSRKVLTHSVKYFSISCCCNTAANFRGHLFKGAGLAAAAPHHLDQLNAFRGGHRGHFLRFQFVQEFGQPGVQVALRHKPHILKP